MANAFMGRLRQRVAMVTLERIEAMVADSTRRDALFAATAGLAASALAPADAAQAQQVPATRSPADPTRFNKLANSPFGNNRPTPATAQILKDELLFQRATQTYFWALPLLNTMGMRDGANGAFGTCYNIMQIWEKRLDAKTKITTPNSDLIYGMTFANLADTGPLIFEAPPRLQGILLDFWQRPMPEDGGKFFGDVGLPGPDAGAGGKFLLLPPGYEKPVPKDFYVYRSGTNNVFIFLRAFYQDPKDTSAAVDLLKRSVFYPLGKKDSAKPMQFHDASGKSIDLLPRSDASAFDELKWLVDSEGTNLADPDWLGMRLDGKSAYTLTFPPDGAPPVNGFWSLTMYDPNHIFATNDFHRYSVGTKNLKAVKLNQDGSLTIYIQHQSPGADKEANWLPAPESKFEMTIRTYWPKPEANEGRWTSPRSESAVSPSAMIGLILASASQGRMLSR